MWNLQRRFKNKNKPTCNLVCVHVGIQLSEKLSTVYTIGLSNFSTDHKQMTSTSVDVHCYMVNIINLELL